MYDSKGSKQSLDKLLAGSTKNIWKNALSNELGRIAQGIGNINGNDVIDYINKCDVPNGRIVTYAHFICDHRPLKSDKY